MSFVYHGTSSRHLDDILKHGIRPRGVKGKSNWDHTIKSNPHAVYLTTTYAGYFAGNAAKKKEKWLIAEIDLDRLDTAFCRPDEDYIAQALWMQKSKSPNVEKLCKMLGNTLGDLTEYIRDMIDKYQDAWQESLDNMGTMSYKGVVPIDAITRIAIFDPTSNMNMVIVNLDPSISILNFSFCKSKYVALTKWLMGEKISVADYVGIDWYESMREHINEQEIQEVLNNQKIEIIVP